MITALISKKSIISFFIAFILVFIGAKVQALDATQAAATKYGITFPVSELGGCSNISECRTYCEDPLHQTQCIDFAKKKGFYKEKGQALKTAILNYAKQELDCDSETSCKSFCGEQANWEKCGEFSKKHNLGGGQVEDPAKKEILSKAKDVLGCGSYDECKGFCTKEENRQKCDDFAKLVGLRGGVEHKGPGGCNSEETCKAFCSDPQNYKICFGYSKSNGQTFKGPGGCDSEASCQAYCRQHQDECRLFKGGGGPPPTFNPQDICSKTPNCTWVNNSCSCGSAYPSYTPYPSYSPTPNYTPYPTYSPSPTTSYEDYCKSKGCTWTNNTCQCSTTSSPSPTPTPTPTPTFSTSTNTGTYSSVKGIATVRNFLQRLLDYFQ